MKWLITAATAGGIAAAIVAGATAGTALTKAHYIAKLRTANALSSRADNAAMTALQSKATTAAQVKTKFFAMGKAHVEIGKQFAALTPPKVATKANHDFADAEIVFGQQNEAIAKKLPATKAAIVKYIQLLKPPTAGKMLDRAINELHAAGFKI